MAQHLIPSTATIKAIKPGDLRRRLSDGAGLYMLLFVKGGSHGWRYDYALHARRNTLSLGTFPQVGLAEARKRAEEVRKLVGRGVDPSEARKGMRAQAIKERAASQRAAAGLPPENSFEAGPHRTPARSCGDLKRTSSRGSARSPSTRSSPPNC
jgi:hypothetical protein